MDNELLTPKDCPDCHRTFPKHEYQGKGMCFSCQLKQARQEGRKEVVEFVENNENTFWNHYSLRFKSSLEDWAKQKKDWGL